jgi:hypothetical protein
MVTFKIGEIVIMQNCMNKSLSGMEAEIIEGLESRLGKQTGERFKGYAIIAANGVKYAARPNQLRKKEPPKRDIDRVVRWEDCCWMPRELIVSR